MNDIFSSGALQQDDELVLQKTIQKDFVTNNSYSSLDLRDGVSLAMNNSINEKGKRQRKSSSFQDDDENKGNGKQKRIIHRDIERQRRQEMANLHASLRMQLPLENIKGKRSVSDLIHETENYIKFKEKNIEELKDKRDTLKNHFTAARDDLNSRNQSSSCSYRLPIDVTVESNSGGVEILISVDLKNDTFSLSRVLEIVTAEGLSVVSCVCTKANGRILHSIQTETGHGGGVEIDKLKQKLTNIVNTP